MAMIARFPVNSLQAPKNKPCSQGGRSRGVVRKDRELRLMFQVVEAVKIVSLV